MASYFTVVQYVPDPVTDERINFGVIVVEQGRVQCRFLSDWRRVKSFGSEDVTFLKDFADRLREATSDIQVPLALSDTARTFDEDWLKELSGEWINSIQLTPPRASLQSSVELLAEMSERFLKEPARKKRAFRDRRAAVGLAARELQRALSTRMGTSAVELVKRNVKIQGRLDAHEFDVGVVNSAPYVVAQGLSFEIPESDALDKEVEATAWAVDDVRHSHPRFPIAIVTLRSSAESRAFSRAQRIFLGLGASMVMEETVQDWASGVAARVKPL